MAAGHVDDFVQELKRVGEVAFRKRHTAPVLIVTGRATRGKRADTDEVTRVTSLKGSGKHRGSLALFHRVFPLAKAHPAAGPVLEVSLDGAAPTPAVVKDAQRHPVRGDTMHIDLVRVRLDQAIQATVAIELLGGESAPGVR